MLMDGIIENEAHLDANEIVEPVMEEMNQGESESKSESKSESTMEHDESYTRGTTGNMLDPLRKREQKILGVKWNYEQDCFVLDLSPIAQAARECQPTKRYVISIASKFYDPLGFISAIIIQMKLLFQSICDSRQEWDTLLEAELKLQWCKLVGELEKTARLALPECYFVHIKEEVVARQLHGFCDAFV